MNYLNFEIYTLQVLKAVSVYAIFAVLMRDLCNCEEDLVYFLIELNFSLYSLNLYIIRPYVL